MSYSQPRAFTLVELLVVITIIVVLLAMLVPALDRAMEQTSIAVCGANQRSINSSSLQYAMANKKVLVICRARVVQICFNVLDYGLSRNGPDDNVDWMAALATVGLAQATKTAVLGSPGGQGVDGIATEPRMEHLPTEVWDCPSRGFKSGWDPRYNQVIISYQYFGGMRTWTNPWITMPSRSPLTLGTSRPDWVLTADTTWRLSGIWGYDNGWAAAYGGIPSHKAADGVRPAGHNQSYMDGSVGWADFADMVYISNWTAAANFETFWHQRDLGGWDPPGPALGRNAD